MNIRFERAVPADAEALVRVQVAAFDSDAQTYPGVAVSGPPGYDSVPEMLHKVRQDECYKIVVDEQIVGGFVLFDRGEGHRHLDALFIDPAYHNRGIGSRAMQCMEQAYPTTTRWTLDTPTYATRNQHFYEKFGYVRVGEVVYDDISLIAYEKRL